MDVDNMYDVITYADGDEMVECLESDLPYEDALEVATAYCEHASEYTVVIKGVVAVLKGTARVNEVTVKEYE